MSGLAHPEWTAALLGAWAVLALLTAGAVWRAQRALRGLGASAHGAGLWRDLTLCGALLALVFAWLGPQLGTRHVFLPAGGIDLVLLIDLSHSMDAADTPPSRLARAREAAAGVLRGLDAGDRAALAVFAGHGELLTPLTHDSGALLEMLPALDSERFADRGSRLWSGVEASLAAFEPDSLRPRVVLTLGDGERAQLVANASLALLGRSQVRVVAGAIGSEAGSAIVGAAGPLLDWNGDAVVTRRETKGFEKFARASGGVVVLADEWGALDSAALLAAARQGLRPGPGDTIERELPARQHAALAALAFALLLFELLAGEGPQHWLRGRRAGARAALAALALLAVGAGASLDELEAQVEATPEDANALLALGVARYEAGDAAEAARAFAAATVRARAPEDIALANFDLGVALLELGDFAGARDAFFDALAYAPSDGEAAFNLEWALRALDSEPPPPEAPRPSEDAPPDARADPDPADEPEASPTPLPSPPAEPEASPRAEPEADSHERPAALSPDEVSRWLESLRDEAPRAAERPHARSGPQW